MIKEIGHLTLLKLFFKASTSFLIESNFASVASNRELSGSAMALRLLSISGAAGGFKLVVTIAVRDCRDFLISSNASFVFFCVTFSLSSFCHRL